MRGLAHSLGVTRLTVENAYAELQADGWVEATVGRGAFVSTAVQQMSLQPTVGQYLTPDSAINDMLAINQVIGVRSMAMAHANASLFSYRQLLAADGPAAPGSQPAVQLRPHIQGDAALRVAIAQMLHEDGIAATQRSVSLPPGRCSRFPWRRAVCQPGDAVLVEQPTFLGC